LELGVVAHTCDPEALRRWRQEDFEFEVSLSYKARPLLGKKQKRHIITDDRLSFSGEVWKPLIIPSCQFAAASASVWDYYRKFQPSRSVV
jgi:hypothetical protein